MLGIAMGSLCGSVLAGAAIIAIMLMVNWVDRSKKDLRLQPRWLQAVRAFATGYFWLPCSMCGEYRGGHEKSGSLWVGGGAFQMVCANCAEDAREQTEARCYSQAELDRFTGREPIEEP